MSRAPESDAQEPPPPEVDPFDELAPMVGRGDQGAIAAVYRGFAPSMRAMLLVNVGNESVADDIVGETFVELVQAAGKLDFSGAAPGRRLRAWLIRAARNNLIDWRRAGARREQNELTGARSNLAVDTDDLPDDQAVRQDAFERATERLRALPASQREVIELRLIAGLDLKEVAEITGKSVGAVKALQHRGMNTLVRTAREEGE